MKLAHIFDGGETDELDFFSVLEEGIEAIAGDVVDVAVDFDFEVVEFT